MPEAILICVGAAVVAVTLVDVFYTVLFPASGHGPLRKPLARALRGAFGLTRHLSPSRRRRVLSYAGPSEVLATLVVWFVLLLVGWAAIYRPALGSSVVAASGPTHVGWGTALYVSGFSVTTLGTGDVVATTTAYRLLMVLEAVTGFATFTLVLSYFNSVYTTLTSRNAFAMALHHRSGGTGRGDAVVAALWDEGGSAAGGHLAEMAGGLRTLAQTHRAYPVLRSFHYRQGFDALPQILLTCLETTTLLLTTLDDQAVSSRPALRGSSVHEIHEAARAFVSDRMPDRPDGPTPQQRRAWESHHAQVLERLAEAGVPVACGTSSAEAYVERRATWDAGLADLAGALLYEWPDDVMAPGRTSGADASV